MIKQIWALIAVLGVLVIFPLSPPLCADQTNSPAVPHPPTGLPFLPPEFPAGWHVAGTNEIGGVILAQDTSYEWEITFEYSTDVAFTNVMVYPITVNVPFENGTEFVRVVARKKKK